MILLFIICTPSIHLTNANPSSCERCNIYFYCRDGVLAAGWQSIQWHHCTSWAAGNTRDGNLNLIAFLAERLHRQQAGGSRHHAITLRFVKFVAMQHPYLHLTIRGCNKLFIMHKKLPKKTFVCYFWWEKLIAEVLPCMLCNLTFGIWSSKGNWASSTCWKPLFREAQWTAFALLLRRARLV